MAFDRFAQDYAKNGKAQLNAAKKLMQLSITKPDMSILDIGCGEGKVTNELKKLTNNRVIGIDPSQNMIKLAKERFANSGIDFYTMPAAEVEVLGKFDVIFCNSVFHWLSHHQSLLKMGYNILNAGGVFALQTPSTPRWCPFINDALDFTLQAPSLHHVGKFYKTPWTYFETEENYICLFEQVGFEVTYCEIMRIPMKCSIDEIIAIFDSGCSAAFFDPKNYSCVIDEDYEKSFRAIFKENIEKMASSNLVNIEFKRLFLIAQKPVENL